MSILNTGLAKSSAADAYTIDNSLRFDDGASAYLSKTFASAGDRNQWTFSCWVKRGTFPYSGGNDPVWLNAGEGRIGIDRNDNLWVRDVDGTQKPNLKTTQLFRDPSAWYHFVVAMDTPQLVAANRTKIYVNGSQVTAFGTETYPDQNQDTTINNNVEHLIGKNSGDSGQFDGYLAEVYFIDGETLAADSFGELNATTNQWRPIDASGLSFGTNGFYQKYGATELADSFKDSSRSSIEFVPTEALTIDAMLVGGGGGGSHAQSGGGGGGGMVTLDSFAVTAQSYPIVIGAGGAATNNLGASGSSTTALGETATGGGGGGFTPGTGGNGANGGGGGTNAAGGTGTVPPVVASEATGFGGYGGGTGPDPAGGGGGGLTAVGQAAVAYSYGGVGGAGKQYNLDGNNYYWGGGGGGAAYAANAGNGGIGGGGGGGTAASGSGGTGGGSAKNTGGTGTSDSTEGGDGGANTGGGGGGGKVEATPGSGGDGGSGIVQIRYASATAKATGGTITTYTDGVQYQVHTFTSAPHTITAEGDAANTRAVRKVGDSSIAFDGTGDYLTVPDSSDWNFGSGEFTIEFWVNFNTIAGQMMSQYDYGASQRSWVFSNASATDLEFTYSTNGSSVAATVTGTWAPSTGTWHHLAVSRDSSSDLRLFGDGIQVGTSNVTDTFYDSSAALAIANYLNSGAGGTSPLNGYMDEIRISNTARYTGNFTTFGQGGGTIANPTAFTADANTKLLIHSNWDGGLGADSSGNYNTFTATNLVATDSMIDVPTNSFATLNPLVKPYGTNTYSEGNLKTVSGSGWQASMSTISVSSGKWYYETLSGGANQHCYIIGAQTDLWFRGGQSPQDTTTGTIGYMGYDGNKRIDATDTSYGDTFTSGDIIAVALDLDASTPTVTFYKNNVAQDSGTPITFSGNILNSSIFLPAFVTLSQTTYWNFGADSSFAGEKTSGSAAAQDSAGKGDFFYTPPTDYLALCSDNLPSPDIALPGENFNTILYTGTGASHAITGFGFAPDFFWNKSRTTTHQHMLYTTVMGATKYLVCNDVDAEATDANSLTSFDSDGVTLGSSASSNATSVTFASWGWKAGGAPTADNSAGVGAVPTAGSVKIDGSNLGSALAGSIAATKISANTTAGFSIVSYTGDDASSATIGHGLGVAPELVIIKGLDSTENWYVGSSKGSMSFTSSDYLSINTDSGESSSDTIWDDTAPTPTVFTVGTNNAVNNTDDFIAYCFHSVEGYSKVGSYTGNGNADGPFIYTNGFRPAYLLLKRTDSATDWFIEDSKRLGYNVDNNDLMANTTAAEQVDDRLDIVSNGFKLRSTFASTNASGGTYLYYAVAASPFKTSNAR